jgi:RNA recognition motif-containing protein
MIKDKEKSTFAFVEFDDIRDAETALNKLKFTEIRGYEIRIQFANNHRAKAR